MTLQTIRARMCLLGALAALSSPVMADLVMNGDFEGDTFGTYTVALQGFPGWTVLGGSTDSVTIFPGVPPLTQGPVSDHLDLGGFTDSIGQGVEQVLATVAGRQYRLKFDYWTGGTDLPGGLMDVFLGGTLIADDLNSGDDPGVRIFTQTFTASGATTLRFLTASNGFGIDIDNVTVADLPEPWSLSLFIAGLLGLFASCRRQAASSAARVVPA